MQDTITEYYIGKIEEDEYIDRFKRKLTLIWKDFKYSTFIQSEYLDDKIIKLEDLEDFLNSVFNKKKFYNLNTSYDFYFCDIDMIQLNITLEVKIHEQLKPLKQEYAFFLEKDEKKTMFQYIRDLIFNYD